MGIIEGTGKVTAGGPLGRTRRAVGLYDFAVDGGAVGDITLRGDTIPSGAIITDVFVQVDTPPASGGAATVAVRAEAAGDVQAGAAVSGTPWSTSGPKRVSFTATSPPIKATVARNLVATVGTAPLTAGKFTVAVDFLELA